MSVSPIIDLPDQPVIHAADGARLCVTRFGAAGLPVVLLVLPSGVTYQPLLPWIDAVSATHQVVTLETRWILDATKPADDLDRIGLDSLVEDVLAVVDGLALSTIALAGYCNGAGVTLQAATRLGGRLRALVLANGAYRSDVATAETDYERDMAQMRNACVRNPKAAQVLQAAAVRRSRQPQQEEFRRDASIAFRDVPTFLKYMTITAALFRDMPDTHGDVSAPMLILHGTGDAMVSPNQSINLARDFPHAQLVCPDGEDHYGWCRPRSPSVLAAVDFLNAHR